MSHLFDSLKLRSITCRNRIGVSPMCQYSAVDGVMQDWHLVHLGSRAIGGAGLIIAEATAVEARGRISPADAGLWSDDQVEPLQRINGFIKHYGAVPGVQLGHAGRKAGTPRPWDRNNPEAMAQNQPWPTIAPSPIVFGGSASRMPQEMSVDDIHQVQQAFRDATARALEGGYEFVELHGAHGYLVHSFHSPLSNQRTDDYGGSFENRVRFTIETIRLMREVWPEDKPLAVRLSCTDWVEGGWSLEESIELSVLLKDEGVDFIDCSSGGAVLKADIPVKPGFQVPFATAIRKASGLATAAVGLVTDPTQADQIIRDGQADMILLGRESLRNPYWPLHAARELDQADAMPYATEYDWAVG